MARPGTHRPPGQERPAALHRLAESRSTVHAAARLPRFGKPALVAWSADDVFFALEDGQRLAEVLPDGRLEVIERARTFSMIDQPDALADLIADFAQTAANKRAA